MAKIYDFDNERNKDLLKKIDEIKKGHKFVKDARSFIKSEVLSDKEKLDKIKELLDIYYNEHTDN